MAQAILTVLLRTVIDTKNQIDTGQKWLPKASSNRLCACLRTKKNNNEPPNEDELKEKRLSEIREKIDRGLKQLDEGRGINAKDARIQLRRIRNH